MVFALTTTTTRWSSAGPPAPSAVVAEIADVSQLDLQRRRRRLPDGCRLVAPRSHARTAPADAMGNPRCSTSAPSTARSAPPNGGHWSWPSPASGPLPASRTCSRLSHLGVSRGSRASASSGPTYSSPYVTFTGVEQYSDVRAPNGVFTRIATLTPAQSTLDRYGPIAVPGWTRLGRTFPFVDVGNGWSAGPRGSARRPRRPVPGHHRQPPRRSHQPVTRAVMASANYLTAAICRPPTSNQPGVRHQGGPAAALCPRLIRWPELNACIEAGLPAAQPARRSTSCLRSISFRPPQMPWGSRMRMA